jgi:NtrC-family two-component system sensor histidine kinase KinB
VADELLQESLEALYELAPCGYLLTRPDGTIVRANQTFLDWVARAPADLVGTSRFQDLLTIPGKLFYENQYAPLLRLQGFVNAVAFDLVRPDAEPLPVLITSVRHPDVTGQAPTVASIILDATDRRAYERELLLARRRAEQLAAIVTESGDAILSLAPDGVVLTWNAGAERLLGYTAAEIVGRDLWAILHLADGHAALETAVATLRSGEAVRFEAVVTGPDGRRVDVSAGLAPHLGPLGELAAISAILRDIGERKAVERQQREFISMVTHELRNPLASLRGYAQIMRHRGEYMERGLDVILTQSRRLERLIGDLLDVSRVESGQLALQRDETDLVSLSRAAADQAQALTRAHEVRFEGPDEPLFGWWDRDRLAQVLQNLLTNATKYSPDGGTIVVRVAGDGGEVRVSVADQGPGIAPEALPNLFRRFYRTAEAKISGAEGLGLGLYISRSLVEAHGGRIWAESIPGQGSTFTFTLPRADRTEAV